MNERTFFLHYAHTPADYLEAQTVLYPKTPAAKINIAVGLILAGLGVFDLFRIGWHWMVVFLFAFAALAGFGVLTLLLQRVMIKVRWSAKAAQDYETMLSPESVRFHTAMTDTTIKWAQFEDVVESPNLFLLKSAKLTYIMIPKRALQTSEEKDAFRTLLAQRIPG